MWDGFRQKCYVYSDQLMLNSLSCFEIKNFIFKLPYVYVLEKFEIFRLFFI
jgi:hypothetical protein